jgi:hypothetical protein
MPLPYPDLAYIRRSVPIRDVARQLDLRIAGNMVHCWRPQNHQHGDRTPSVGLHVRRNRAKCFVCDARQLSPIDLVMSVLGLNLAAGVQWITSRFDVPPTPKGKHIQHAERWHERFRVGSNDSLQHTLVRSGIWASLTPAQRSIIPVLVTFADPSTNVVTISYRGLMRFAGVGSHSTVATAFKRFQALRFLAIGRATASDGLRACNVYRLTQGDPTFLRLANETYGAHKDAIEAERELRAAARRNRLLALRARARPLPVTSLSNGCSNA